MARHAALATGLARFLTGPLVGGALLMRRLAAFTRDLALLVSVHRCKAAIFCSHAILLGTPVLANTRAATDVPRKSRKSQPYSHLGKRFPLRHVGPSFTVGNASPLGR